MGPDLSLFVPTILCKIQLNLPSHSKTLWSRGVSTAVDQGVTGMHAVPTGLPGERSETWRVTRHSSRSLQALAHPGLSTCSLLLTEQVDVPAMFLAGGRQAEGTTE